MLVSKQKSGIFESAAIGTAEAFYTLYRALPKKDRRKVAQYILEDTDVQIPNKTTLKSFGEDKTVMPVFNSVDELRKDLLS
ncbi:Uncharacterized protein dnl_38750 [Desulfonema limicola]|uniref:Uncharacterized protein n=1 Tax=Desulfonema limicola TaxID=45656 RepID=A0A975GI62_9BACT|nr:hypothetical protein [Desulfonema limicola]QTA81538.1 Uncharacterized protein dnl_38750 [Desulfonema limicola]